MNITRENIKMAPIMIILLVFTIFIKHIYSNVKRNANGGNTNNIYYPLIFKVFESTNVTFFLFPSIKVIFCSFYKTLASNNNFMRQQF